MMAQIITSLLQWAIKWAAAAGYQAFNKYQKDRTADAKVDGQLGAVNKAIDEAVEALKEVEQDGSIPKAQEQKLREATRRLTDNLLG